MNDCSWASAAEGKKEDRSAPSQRGRHKVVIGLNKHTASALDGKSSVPEDLCSNMPTGNTGEVNIDQRQGALRSLCIVDPVIREIRTIYPESGRQLIMRLGRGTTCRLLIWQAAQWVELLCLWEDKSLQITCTTVNFIVNSPEKCTSPTFWIMLSWRIKQSNFARPLILSDDRHESVSQSWFSIYDILSVLARAAC